MKKILKTSKPLILALSCVAFFSSPILAGEIVGMVGPATGSSTAPQAVVWIENAPSVVDVSNTKNTLSQRNVTFSPSMMVVVVGQTVDMPNDDNIAHNVFSYSPAKQFNLGIYPKGESRAVTFNKPGLVDVFCSIHRNMNAKIFVVPNEFYATGEMGSRYRIKDVPAGTYTLKAWHKDFSEQSKAVTVPISGEVVVDFMWIS